MKLDIYDGVLRVHTNNYRKKLFEFSFSWGFAFTFRIDDEGSVVNIHFLFFDLFITLPYTKKVDYEWHKYGIYYFDRAFWLCWEHEVKAIHMPWSYPSCYKKEYYDWEGKYVFTEICKKSRYNYTRDEAMRLLISKTFPYKYTLKNGNVQERKATIYQTIQYWRMRGFPFIIKTSKCINVEFNDEVGERTGSWKGGTLGCGYEMRDGETPEETLRRMERERKF